MTDLFSLSATTPAAGMVHGDAIARGEVQASALLRRGIDLRAGFDLAASLRGALGDGIAAKVAAGVGIQAGIAVQAAIPLDLFHEAGVVARFQAQAAAAAWVNASLSLSPEQFEVGVRRLVPAPLDELLGVFLDEVEFSAGLWARAAFAAEIRGEAVLTGSLLASAGHDPGFSFAMRYAAGLAYGAGKEFVANVGFADPGRLLDRLGDRMVTVVLREAERMLAAQPEDTREAAATALAVLRVLLPLGTRAAFRAGMGLTEATGAARRATATGGVLDGVIQSIQAQLLSSLGALAFDRLARLLGSAAVLGDIPTDPARSAQARAELVALGDRLAELDKLQPADARAWLAGVLAVLGPLGRLLDLGLMPGQAGRIRHALALLWSTAVLLERVRTWYDDPARVATGLFGNVAVTAPADGGFAAVVAQAAGRPAGTALRLQDVLTFLLGARGLIDDLRAAVPTLGAALDAIEALTGSPAGLAVQELLIELAAPSADRAKVLLDTLTAAAGPLVREEVAPKVLDPLKAAHPNDDGFQRLIDELVRPMLLGLPAVVLPNLAAATTDEGALRLREAVSAVLLQPLALYTLAGVDVLLEHALTNGEQALLETAAMIEQIGESWGGLGALLVLALEAPLPVQVSPEEAAALLELAAVIAKGVNLHQRGPVLDGLRALTRLGFESAAGREASLATLLGSSDPPDQTRLEAALVTVRDGSWDVVKLVAPKALELLAAHYLGVVKALATAVASAARALIEAAKEGLALLGETVAELWKRVGELVRAALDLVGQFAGQVRALAERAKTFVEAVVERIRAAGRDLLEPLLTSLPKWAADALRGIYDTLFDTARSALTAPLGLLAGVAGLVEDACNALVHLDATAVKQEIRRRILGTAASDLHFDLALWVDPPPVAGYDPAPFKLFDLGRVTVPSAWVLTTVADVLLDDALVGQKLTEATATQAELRAVQAEEATVRQLAKGAQGQQAAQADAARLTPGQPLGVRFLVPADQAVAVGVAGVRIRIDGANATFVRPTLGVQPRVVVRVNGRTWHYDPALWVERSGGVELAVILVPLPEPPPPADGPGMHPATQVRVEAPTGVLASFEQADGALHLAFQVPQAPTVIVPDQPLRPQHRIERVPAADVLGSPARAARSAGPAMSADTSGAGAVHTIRAAGAATISPRQPASTVNLLDAQVQAEVEAVSLGLDPYGTPVVAGRLGLNAVQVAVADGAGLEAGEHLLCFIQPDTRKVAVVEVIANPPDQSGEPDESIAIGNDGSDDVDLTGWTLRNLAQDQYEFPQFVLWAGRTVRVWTGPGVDDDENLHWDRQTPVWWSDRGGTAILADTTGRDISRLTYVLGRPG